MQAQRRRDTASEVALRSKLHRLRLRFRVERRIEGQRGRIDIVFPSSAVAVFVDGCFWHSCPDHATVSNANREWWGKKLSDNVERDVRHDAELDAGGWIVVRFWEHESPLKAADAIADVVRARRMGSDGAT